MLHCLTDFFFFATFCSGGGTDWQGGHRHLYLPSSGHHGDAAERGEADREGEGQRESRKGAGSQTQQLTALHLKTQRALVENHHRVV